MKAPKEDLAPGGFVFYPRDFSSDAKVELMTTEGVGAYVLLLCKAWFEEPPGSLPDDDRALAVWARMSLEGFRAAKPSILAPFELKPDGRWHQKRMQSEYRKFAQIRAKRSKAAQKRWGPNRAMQMHSKSNAKVMQRACNADALGGYPILSYPILIKPKNPPPTPPRGGSDSAKPKPKRGRPAYPADEAFIEELKQNPAYSNVPIEVELGKMQAWFTTPKGKGRQMTRAFVLNWLNRAEEKARPLETAALNGHCHGLNGAGTGPGVNGTVNDETWTAYRGPQDYQPPT
jgi:uncharacterized protein YdaU (DUF1376 family)